mgnify:CR=1 FL=1
MKDRVRDRDGSETESEVEMVAKAEAGPDTLKITKSQDDNADSQTLLQTQGRLQGKRKSIKVSCFILNILKMMAKTDRLGGRAEP